MELAYHLLVLGLSCLSLGHAYVTGDVKLDGSIPGQGILMVYYNGRFGYVCDDGMNGAAGLVICRNLNREFINYYIGRSARSGSTYVLDDIRCKGTESNLNQCSHSPWLFNNCGSKEHVSMHCGETPCDKAPCSQSCNVLRQGYNCSCYPGYKLEPDGITCSDIDECQVENGGCSHTCVNTNGSYHCECPRYLYLDKDNHTCTADGFTVDCTSSFGMTIIMEKKTFFFLPDALTLTNTSCTSKSNSTHIWLYTDYNACSTHRRVEGSDIIYSNAVLDSKNSVGGIRFFDSIKIPFQCRLSTNHSISQGLNPGASELIMRVSESSQLGLSLKLLNGDSDDSPELPSYDVKQGGIVYAKFYLSIPGINVEPESCAALSADNVNTQSLILNGRPATFLTTVLSSNQFRFSYPVFTFGKKTGLKLSCNSHLSVNNSLLNGVNQTLIITPQEIQEALQQTSNSVGQPVRRVIVTTQGVQLRCEENSMKLILDPSVTVGLNLEDLQPLRENCFGYYSTVQNGSFVYSIPLVDCGAEVETQGNEVTFTNSLVYASNMVSKVKYFTDVILTHSCSYSLTDYSNSRSYTVRPSNFAFGAENKQKANFDISLNVFSDDQFKQLLNNGGAVSVSEGKKLFGDIGVSSNDANLKVALNNCKVTPTNRADDPNSRSVIENGCKTAYGIRVFSPKRFSISTRSFVDHRGQQAYLHCSVVVCGPSNMARCIHSCTNPDGVVGKRDADSLEIAHVSAGPFFIHQ
ncbi:oncoprotein-induced transcript 3 protein-like [Watersipora subatra]|uniref:oncoprotein-induced transcript 3 protein-like n=1 Tax=Watersipora subatra TaxID=2589382 RepID=UPI00355B7A80